MVSKISQIPANALDDDLSGVEAQADGEPRNEDEDGRHGDHGHRAVAILRLTNC